MQVTKLELLATLFVGFSLGGFYVQSSANVLVNLHNAKFHPVETWHSGNTASNGLYRFSGGNWK
jgi:hypothetical protein